MFWQIFKTQLKVTLADRTTVFWALAFPLVLGTLFHFAFGNLNSTSGFTAVPVAIVDDASYKKDTALSRSLDALTAGSNKIFVATHVSSKAEAVDLLSDRKVDGIIESDGAKGKVTVRGGGGDFNETIVKTAVEQSTQTTSAITAALSVSPQIMTKLAALDTNYLKDSTNGSMDRTVLYFYSLIGMACLYAGFFGIYAANRNEANLSKLGARLAVSPTSKAVALLAAFCASVLVAFVGQLILYLFLTRVLGVNFGKDAWAILLVMLVGCVSGVGVGIVIGSTSKRTESMKINILTLGTMICSVFAGMMGSAALKHAIDEGAPLFSVINPVNMITDALYAIYYFGVGTRYWYDILFIGIFAAVMLLVSWIVLRRKTYASL